jgi:N-acetyl-alpha-D-muramate 1-phosphate uridylyltransferase
MMPKVAMVLAAGLGKRMRPLTDTLPKPLVPVAGRALIDRVLDRLEEAGIGRVVVNLHHFRPTLEAHLRQRAAPKLQFKPEAELLETGGGVKNALDLLGPDAFFVTNADVLWLDGKRSALGRLGEAWNDKEMDALLLLQRTTSAFGYEGSGDYFCDPLGRLRRRKGNEISPYIFAGIQILHPRLFAGAPDGAFSLNRLYNKAQEEGRLFGLVHDGRWFHVGTPEGLAETEAELGYVPPPRAAPR